MTWCVSVSCSLGSDGVSDERRRGSGQGPKQKPQTELPRHGQGAPSRRSCCLPESRAMLETGRGRCERCRLVAQRHLLCPSHSMGGWSVATMLPIKAGRLESHPPPPPLVQGSGSGSGSGSKERTRHWSPDRQAASTFASSRYCQPAAHSGRAFCTPSPVCADDEDRVPFSPFFVGSWWTAVGDRERKRARRSANPTPSRLISMLQPAKDLLNRTACLHVARTHMTTVFIQPLFLVARRRRPWLVWSPSARLASAICLFQGLATVPPRLRRGGAGARSHRRNRQRRGRLLTRAGSAQTFGRAASLRFGCHAVTGVGANPHRRGQTPTYA